jgi:hypothetical protein
VIQKVDDREDCFCLKPKAIKQQANVNVIFGALWDRDAVDEREDF